MTTNGFDPWQNPFDFDGLLQPLQQQRQVFVNLAANLPVSEDEKRRFARILADREKELHKVIGTFWGRCETDAERKGLVQSLTTICFTSEKLIWQLEAHSRALQKKVQDCRVGVARAKKAPSSKGIETSIRVRAEALWRKKPSLRGKPSPTAKEIEAGVASDLGDKAIHRDAIRKRVAKMIRERPEK